MLWLKTKCLHDVVRTYTRMIFPAPWFPFLWRGIEKKQQTMLLLLTYFKLQD